MPESGVIAVERALTILDSFDGSPASLTLAELVERTGMYRSTILRITASLIKYGYLYRDSRGVFRLGGALFRQGAIYQQSFNLGDYLRPVLSDIVEEVGETAAFYVKENDSRVCLFRHQSPQQFPHHVVEGAVLPLRVGASGRILVAFEGAGGEVNERIRQDGYYVSYGERNPEATAVSFPVFGSDGTLVGALGVTGPRPRMTPARVETVREALQRASRNISAALGASDRPR